MDNQLKRLWLEPLGFVNRGSKSSRLARNGLNLAQVGLLVWIGLLGAAERAAAHHPFGGRTPATFIEGFLSGLGHPVIGFDHLAFVIAVGLLAATITRGSFIPVAFMTTAMLGTVLHLQAVNLPVVEFAVASSVILFGAIVSSDRKLSLNVLVAMAAIAGLFHGYAYGEAVVGANMGPVIAYLLGFTLIQSLIALSVMFIVKKMSRQLANSSQTAMRTAGFAICSVGAIFLATSLVG